MRVLQVKSESENTNQTRPTSMRAKTIYRICVVALLTELIKCQRPTIAIQECIPPPLRSINPLEEEQNITDTYPKEVIEQLLQDKATARRVNNVIKRFRYCTKTIPMDDLVEPRKSNSTQRSVIWRDTCPATTRYHYIPKKVWYGRVNKFCWILHPWRETYCSYATCVSSDCQDVAVPEGKGRLPPRCIQSRWERIYYYLICPNPWRLYQRYVFLPRSCSCETLMC